MASTPCAQKENNVNTDADFNIDINDFKNITDLMDEIFDRVYNSQEYNMTKSISEVNNFMISSIEKNKTVPTNTEKLRFYTYFIILLNRAKNQTTEISEDVIRLNFEGENLSMSIGKWIKFVINPAIDKINRKIKSFKTMTELIDDYKIAEIKFVIDDYLSTPQSIHLFKARLSSINTPENCPRAQKFIKAIFDLCSLLDYIGDDSFEICLKNMLLKF
jgi:hypothetical protein